MAIFKCKMCGGSLEIFDGISVATCEYCGTKQTVPKSRDEVVSNLFNRANNLRLKCEFDKAEQVYEKILDIDNTDSEAHWGIVLCKYGIEYVEDPQTYSRIPTCHRTLYEVVLTDVNYLAAIENADAEQKELYIAESKIIDELQKNILNIVNSEEPFDVFLCYKETDENGKRTVDSAIANDIYYQLTHEGFKVFYAPITLEDKLGHEYEPYIFAALNSAKVMLVVGTKPEYFDSVWVRNEWSRFFKSMKNDRSKLLIPCYRNMDAYDLPNEFAHLQAQDMSKIGFISDVIRGLKKVFNRDDQPKQPTKRNKLKKPPKIKPIIEKRKQKRKLILSVTAVTLTISIIVGIVWFGLSKFNSAKIKNEQEQSDSSSLGSDKGENNFQNITLNLHEMSVQYHGGRNSISAGSGFTIGLKKDGTVVATGGNSNNECNVLNWKDIVAISAGSSYTVGIKKDGTVVAAVDMDLGRCDVSNWKDIVDISASDNHTVGLKKDGTVIASGNNHRGECNISKWRGIVAISAGHLNTIGLKKDGTVVATGYNADGQCKVSGWKNIKAISTGVFHTVGLKKDGTVVATGENTYGQCNVAGWYDIVAISAGDYHTVGIKKDGTVVATGDNRFGQCNVSDWDNIVAISAGNRHTIGLKKDGTVVATGENTDGQCDVAKWTNIKTPQNEE